MTKMTGLGKVIGSRGSSVPPVSAAVPLRRNQQSTHILSQNSPTAHGLSLFLTFWTRSPLALGAHDNHRREANWLTKASGVDHRQ